MLTAHEMFEDGNLAETPELQRDLVDMIRVSSNGAATRVIDAVGFEAIRATVTNPRYRLYDPAHNGGLWVGKDFAKAGLWKRDPLHNLSHGATAMQVARFYYLMQTGNLVTPEYSAKMKKIMSDPGIEHKFVRSLHMINPRASLFRKSGSWRTYHSDSVLVERDGKAYIAVALSDSTEGKTWLHHVIVACDDIIFGHTEG